MDCSLKKYMTLLAEVQSILWELLIAIDVDDKLSFWASLVWTLPTRMGWKISLLDA